MTLVTITLDEEQQKHLLARQGSGSGNDWDIAEKIRRALDESMFAETYDPQSGETYDPRSGVPMYPKRTPAGRQDIDAMNAQTYKMTPEDREKWYSEHPVSSYE